MSLTRFQLYVILMGYLYSCHVPRPQNIFPQPQEPARCAAMVASHLLCCFDLIEPDAFPAIVSLTRFQPYVILTGYLNSRRVPRPQDIFP